jgi:type I restriction enzyme S subunit
MTNNWKTYKLGDLAKLRKKNIIPKDFDNQKYISLEHISQGTFLLDGLGKASDATSNKSLFENGDILYGKIRPYFKKVYRPKFSGICSTDILVINSKNEELITQNYLHQIIKNQYFTDKATETSSGTKMPRADWNSLEKLEYNLPPIQEQKSIAQILSTIDDKIENNLAINKTLEEMAMALYKHWFVDSATVDWKKFYLQDLIEIKGGFSYKGEFIGKGDSLLLGMGCVSYSERFVSSGARLYSGECSLSHYVEPGEIVLATRQQSDNLPILGQPAIVPKYLFGNKIIVGTNLYRVINKSNLSNSLLFQLLKSKEYREHVFANASGTTVRMITKDVIELYELVLPPEHLIHKYNDQISSISEKIEQNTIENITLTQLRDTLLSKLISGEVRLKEFRES